MERAHQDRSYRMENLSAENFGVDNLRSDLRFKDLLKRMNLQVMRNFEQVFILAKIF